MSEITIHLPDWFLWTMIALGLVHVVTQAIGTALRWKLFKMERRADR